MVENEISVDRGKALEVCISSLKFQELIHKLTISHGIINA